MGNDIKEMKKKAREFLKNTVLPNAKKVAGQVGRKLDEVSGEDALKQALMVKKEALMKTGLNENEARNVLKKLVNRILTE